MAALSPDTISRKHKKELAQLRRNKRSLLLLGTMLLASASVLWAAWALLSSDAAQEARTFRNRRDELAASGLDWSDEFLERQLRYQTWLGRYGFGIDERVFELVSSALLQSAAASQSERRSLSFLRRAVVSLHFALLRIAFIVIACWKLWVLALIYGIVGARRKLRAYRADDLLGETGNGRIFYSGIRAGLDGVDEQGLPGLQVTGLASVKRVSESVADRSELARILVEFAANNRTNLGLVQTILAYAEYPAYVADRDHQAELELAFSGETLANHAARLLRSVLTVHRSFVVGQSPKVEAASLDDTTQFDSEGYANAVAGSLVRVLTDGLRKKIAVLSPREVATALLALEAGKVMTYAFEGGKWLRRSSFLQLNARAVLHAVASFAEEYSGSSRALIRQALIYGARTSVFAPVRMPVTLTDECRALRQWVEVLMACPHELAAVSDHAEFFALVTEANRKWEKLFYHSLEAGNLDGGWATPSNLFLLPLGQVLAVGRSAVGATILDRVHLLTGLIAERERVAHTDDSPDETRVSRAVNDRVLPPLDASQQNDLAGRYMLSPHDIKAWSSLRTILATFGWLARRVGDYTVPSSYLIFAVVKPEEPVQGVSEAGLLGIPAMVPFRATRLNERWGKGWSGRFHFALRATMAETRERMQELLRGLPDTPAGDALSGGSMFESEGER